MELERVATNSSISAEEYRGEALAAFLKTVSEEVATQKELTSVLELCDELQNFILIEKSENEGSKPVGNDFPDIQSLRNQAAAASEKLAALQKTSAAQREALRGKIPNLDVLEAKMRVKASDKVKETVHPSPPAAAAAAAVSDVKPLPKLQLESNPPSLVDVPPEMVYQVSRPDKHAQIVSVLGADLSGGDLHVEPDNPIRGTPIVLDDPILLPAQNRKASESEYTSLVYDSVVKEIRAILPLPYETVRAAVESSRGDLNAAMESLLEQSAAAPLPSRNAHLLPVQSPAAFVPVPAAALAAVQASPSLQDELSSISDVIPPPVGLSMQKGGLETPVGAYTPAPSQVRPADSSSSSSRASSDAARPRVSSVVSTASSSANRSSASSSSVFPAAASRSSTSSSSQVPSSSSPVPAAASRSSLTSFSSPVASSSSLSPAPAAAVYAAASPPSPSAYTPAPAVSSQTPADLISFDLSKPLPPSTRPALTSTPSDALAPPTKSIMDMSPEEIVAEEKRAKEVAELSERYLARMKEEKANEEALKKMLEAERKQRQAELDKKLYACNICFGDYPIGEMYIVDECDHRFCAACLKGYLKSKITDGHSKDIHCPAPKCPHLISYEEVRQCADAELFEKYEKFLLEATLNADPNVRWCPRAGCGNAIITHPRGGHMLICPNPKCRYAFCAKCREEWHSDATCEQYMEWKKENSEAESRFASWASANTKKCPKCHSNIEKNGGCNHMTCAKCHHEFCWLCMAEYTNDHFSKGECEQFT